MPDIATIGTALYGPRWQTSLALALDVSDRTVRRWAAGQPVPPGAREDIARLVFARQDELEQIAVQLVGSLQQGTSRGI